MNKKKKRPVKVPRYLPDTWIMVDEDIKGEELTEYLENWKVRANNSGITFNELQASALKRNQPV